MVRTERPYRSILGVEFPQLFILGALLTRERKGCSRKGLIKKAGLPTKGKIRFIPNDKDVQNCQLTRSYRGFIDKFGNIWEKIE